MMNPDPERTLILAMNLEYNWLAHGCSPKWQELCLGGIPGTKDADSEVSAGRCDRCGRPGYVIVTV